MDNKKLLFSVTMKDLEMQTFTVRGAGGGGKDTSNSGVRLTHRASGAVGEGRECRSNTLNRRAAFEKLVASKRFQDWLKVETARLTGRQEIKTTAGTCDKGPKIRTYHYPRHEVTDHRTNKTYQLEPVLDGKLDPVIADLLR